MKSTIKLDDFVVYFISNFGSAILIIPRISISKYSSGQVDWSTIESLLKSLTFENTLSNNLVSEMRLPPTTNSIYVTLSQYSNNSIASSKYFDSHLIFNSLVSNRQFFSFDLIYGFCRIVFIMSYRSAKSRDYPNCS